MEFTLQTAITQHMYSPFCKAAEVAKFTSQKADKHYINYIKSSGVHYPQYTYAKYFAH